MSDDEWGIPPEKIPETDILGIINRRGQYTPRGAPPRHFGNKFQQHDDPVVARIGDWFAECPPDFGTDMAAHGGFLAGLMFGLELDPDRLDELIETFCGRGINPDDKADELREHFRGLVSELLIGEDD